MRCPYCGKAQADAVRSWETDGGVRRLRVCGGCSRQFGTWERLEPAASVVKRDGRRESYSRDKVVRAVRLACDERPVSPQAVENLVDRIEARLFDGGEPEVTSQIIGELVLVELRMLDEVAYLRFASYFRRFANASAFVEEAEALQEWRRRSAEARLQMAFDFDADQPHWN